MSTNYSEIFNKKINEENKRKETAMRVAKEAAELAKKTCAEKLSASFDTLRSVVDKTLEGKWEGKYKPEEKIYECEGMKILSYLCSFEKNNENEMSEFMSIIKAMEFIKKNFNSTVCGKKLANELDPEIRISDSEHAKFIIISFNLNENFRATVITESEKCECIVSIYTKDSRYSNFGFTNQLNYRIINKMYYKAGDSEFGFVPNNNIKRDKKYRKPSNQDERTIRNVIDSIGKLMDASFDAYDLIMRNRPSFNPMNEIWRNW
jgi:hypothetical protein